MTILLIVNICLYSLATAFGLKEENAPITLVGLICLGLNISALATPVMVTATLIVVCSVCALNILSNLTDTLNVAVNFALLVPNALFLFGAF